MLGTGWVRLGHGFGSGRGGRDVIGAGDVSGPGRVLGPGVLGRASSSSATSAAAASATGCAGADQATSVTVHRVLHLVEPTRGNALSKTQHNATLVRALFRQLCAAVSHPSAAKGATLHCPADFGIVYLGTFYDGSRTLAKFSYGVSGCETVSLTADGKTRTTMVIGAASAAAPKLRPDLAAVLGVPRLAIAQPVTGTRNSGATR